MYLYMQLGRKYRASLEKALTSSKKFNEVLLLPLLETAISSEIEARVFERAASRFARNDRFDQAIVLVERLIAWATDNGSETKLLTATYMLGCMRLSKHQHNEAIIEFCKVLSANKKDKLYYSTAINIARTMAEIGQTLEALHVMDISYNLYFWKFGVSIQSVYAAHMYARICAQAGDSARSISLLTEARSYAWAINRDDIARELSRELSTEIDVLSPPAFEESEMLDEAATRLELDLQLMGVDIQELQGLLSV